MSDAFWAFMVLQRLLMPLIDRLCRRCSEFTVCSGREIVENSTKVLCG